MGKIEEAQKILKILGMPKAQYNEISALTLLALCGIKDNSNWNSSYRHSLTISKGIMTFIKNNYNRNYAPNTRETFRRQVLHQFVQGRIADYNPDEPDLPTNSPRAHYAVTNDVLKVIKSFGSKNFNSNVKEFIVKQGSLIEIYQKKRTKRKVPVILPNGKRVELSPGKHNKLQADIIKEFAPRFIIEPIVLYLGDTAQKNLYIENDILNKLGIKITDHDKLPDVIIFDKTKKWIFLIEAVTSHGPMNPKRIFELEEIFKKCKYGKVFVSAFSEFSEFKKHSRNISWETEVWIANFPEHMIHFNGDKFLGPR